MPVVWRSVRGARITGSPCREALRLPRRGGKGTAGAMKAPQQQAAPRRREALNPLVQRPLLGAVIGLALVALLSNNTCGRV